MSNTVFAKKIKELIKLEKLSIDLNLTVIPQAQW